MTESTLLPRKLMLLIAVVQGILLLFLYNASESGSWPSEAPLWNYPLWLLSMAVPVLLMLTLDRGNELRATKLIGVFAVILALVGVYIGRQATPYEEFPVSNMTWVFGLTMTLACFKALMYLQQRIANKPLNYAVLFTYSWRNSLTIALSFLLTFVFWLILILWAQLFRAIEVDFFYHLFKEDWFLFPVLSTAHGVGIIIFRNLTRVIDSITRLFEGLIKILLPLAIVVAVVFLGALPFVGLDALWSTGRGTSLLLWLLAVILFFVNAVYQDGSGERPYPVSIHRLVYGSLLAMPIISALSFYGLYLRLEEYGWTVVRAWAFIVWLVLTLFVVGYTAGILRRRDNWTIELARVNTGMGLVVLALMILTNSPALDFRKISLKSQVKRVESGQVEIEDFDFWYAKHSMARPGYLFMEEMKLTIGDSNPGLLAKIKNPTPASDIRNVLSIEDFWAQARYRPSDTVLPAALREQIETEYSGVNIDFQSLFVRVDPDHDQVDEYMLFHIYNNHISTGWLYFQDNARWSKTNLDFRRRGFSQNVLDELINAEMSIVSPRFNDVEFGEVLIRPNDRNWD